MRPAGMRPDRAGDLLLVAALAVLGASVVNALRIAPPPDRGGAGGVLEGAPAARDAGRDAARALAGARGGGAAREEDAAAEPFATRGSDAGRADRAVLAAVARDPFRPDRRRAPDRYRLPGEAVAVQPAARRAPLPPVRLVGTASFGDGRGYAALVVQDRAPLLVPVGDTLGGLRLLRVDTGSAVLEAADTVVLLEVARRPGGRVRR